MSSSKKCSFSGDWTNMDMSPETARWIRPVEGEVHSARCIVCHKTFSLSNMGKSAVTSHAASQKHRAAVSSLESLGQTRVESFFTSLTASRPAETSGSASRRADISTTSRISFPPTTASSMSSFLIKKDVTKAEIIWCLSTVMTHGSLRSAAASTSLFPLMFPKCKIAARMQLGKDKIAYTICYGIAPYFRKVLLSSLARVTHVVVAFDESLNKVTQTEQMDVLVRYWDPASATVATRYLTSCFLGHTAAEDLAACFRKATEEIKDKNILQISMDGPNVNLKFLKSLKEELKEYDDNHLLLDIGSCGLHVINGAFKAGHCSTGWDLVVFLRSIYNLFKCVPARRADYIRITGSTLFPLKFCAVRWLENRNVLSRALEVLPNLIKFVESSTASKKKPACASYKTVEREVGDKMLPVKLAFMLSISEELEQFLIEFQSNKPMVPFLSSALEALLRSLLGKIVKREVLSGADTPSKLLKIDLDKAENLTPVTSFDIGFAAKNELRKIPKPSQLVLVSFKKDCISFVNVCSQKVVERSPLKYKLTRGASCLDPKCALSSKSGEKRLMLALEVLTEHRWMTGLEAERAYRSYVKLCSLNSTQQLLKNFERKTQRLDTLWSELCSCDHSELLLFVRLILCLSHGNAAVERGFSVNKECLVENLKDESLIAQRIVYDGVSAAGGTANIDITDGMLQTVRSANLRWKDDLERKKKERQEASETERRKRRVASRIKELEQKKQRVMSEALSEASFVQEEIDALKK